MPIDVRAEIRSEVATAMFTAQFSRPPADARELSAQVARLSKPHATTVAGFDLTFSPVKSISSLWALAAPPIAAVIERAHNAAVADTLSFIEQQALFTRMGAGGVRQVDVQGLVGTAFTHRDSRAGDPDLHTHVAVVNKVQTLEGRWLSIDGRLLFKAVVAASETYNTSLETHLTQELGLVFENRFTDNGKRPVREVAGIEPALAARWSARRASITRRAGELARAFQEDHGRTPTPIEKIALAQQATLETRQGKLPARTLAEQRRTWQAEAEQVVGGRFAVQHMLQQVFGQKTPARDVLDDAWYRRTAEDIIATVQAARATWQMWHVHAEALRRARSSLVPAAQVEAVVARLVAGALGDHSVPLTPPRDPISEPVELRRRDGASTYTVAGSALYTSRAILAAEHRLVDAAGLTGGRVIPQAAVELAFARCARDGVELNEGQQHLVRQMATSGRRVQLGIAPAGSGKTTAMMALTTAWQAESGTVVGLAPSAAAADALSQHMPATTDTLAKLTWSLTHPADQPGWLAGIDAGTLVIIDEAGMADTISLDTAIGFLLERGASVRLIGDDQQLAAIGAGGVLRDIATTHGALQLHELVRFADPAEAAASIALREGRPEALGFYLDHGRVHVGDQTTAVEDLFDAWQSDRDAGLDAIMLAPTRDLVADLNHRARTQRLVATPPPEQETMLSDHNLASAGDIVITRANDRWLRAGPTDWVKNGDRWQVEQVRSDGSLQVRHLRHRRAVILPAVYVAAHTELGYATTIHSAQGVSVDTCHGLAVGAESRQQLYTMLTRGRHANHTYLQLVDDGNPHSLIKPDTIAPPTPTELLERILAVDEAPTSATTEHHQAADPARQLGSAAARYTDSLSVAAEQVAAGELADLDRTINQSMPWLAAASSWPTLRSLLALHAVTGNDPLQAISTAAAQTPLAGSADPAAVLAWRIDHTTPSGPAGPLPWLPAVPDRIAADPTWGPYLADRANLVRTLAHSVQGQARRQTTMPGWAVDGPAPSRDTLAAIQVWRAASGVEPGDQRPTGPRQHTAAAEHHQRQLARQLQLDRNPALIEWGPLLEAASTRLHTDRFTPTLARRLSQLSSAGINAAQLLTHAAQTGPLPDDHPAAALWWRISGTVDPGFIAVLDHADTTDTWTGQLETILGQQLAGQLHRSPWWPALHTAIDHALRRGWPLAQLLTPPAEGAGADPCQALVWRTTLLTRSVPPEDEPEPPEQPTQTETFDGSFDLTLEGLIRQHPQPLPTTQLEVREQFARADAWRESGTTPKRLAAINQQAAQLYANHYTGSWAQPYLTARLGTDLAGSQVQPGYAPAGWTVLIDHLRRVGVTDDELLIAGLARRARTGNLLDLFRDRLVLPIRHDGTLLGFTGRANPDLPEQKAGPKYINTPTTPLFHKSDQLYTPGIPVPAGAVPVLAEGPLDAIAITLATAGQHSGHAPLGTSLTETQAAQLAALSNRPIIATDADPAGQAAAIRDYWLLALHHADPLLAELPEGTDPAVLLANGNSAALRAAIRDAQPLAETLTRQRLTTAPNPGGILGAIQVLSARPPAEWLPGIDQLGQHTGLPAELLQQALHDHIQAWNDDPRRAAHAGITWQPSDAKTPTRASRGVPHDRPGPALAEAQPRRDGVSR